MVIRSELQLPEEETINCFHDKEILRSAQKIRKKVFRTRPATDQFADSVATLPLQRIIIIPHKPSVESFYFFGHLTTVYQLQRSHNAERKKL
jgi:hypothetical protein